MSSFVQQMAMFPERFWQDHAGKIIKEPEIAMVELVANAWDAGAYNVSIQWPDINDGLIGSRIEIEDDGTGMDFNEFMNRWSQINYNRRENQGKKVIFPKGVFATERVPFGRNGKGRHGMFCFNTEYYVETWCNGTSNTFLVKKSPTAASPLVIEPIGASDRMGHGTRLWTECKLQLELGARGLRDNLGSHFLFDPNFTVRVNAKPVELVDISEIIQRFETYIEKIGNVEILLYSSPSTSRTALQHGIAWWVEKKRVGPITWNSLVDENLIIDGRTVEGRKLTVVIKVNGLELYVKADWSGFYPEAFKYVTEIEEYLREILYTYFSEARKERKATVLRNNRRGLSGLPRTSKWVVGSFVSEVQKAVPRIKDQDLEKMVSLLAKLEKTRQGYDLISQLEALNPDDLDGLTSLLQRWSVRDAITVLDELEWRLKLIEELEHFTERQSDELHELQPLFEKGLWIFGPQYETVEYTSNKQLATVIRKLIGGEPDRLTTPKRRPDFVCLVGEGRTIAIHSRSRFNEGRIAGIAEVLIIELKRGGYSVGNNEVRQGEDYAREIRKSGRVDNQCVFTVFVLGATLGDDATMIDLPDLKIKVYPQTYDTIITEARNRTFNLLKKLQELHPEDENIFFDPEVEEAIQELPLFRVRE